MKLRQDLQKQLAEERRAKDRISRKLEDLTSGDIEINAQTIGGSPSRRGLKESEQNDAPVKSLLDTQALDGLDERFASELKKLD